MTTVAVSAGASLTLIIGNQVYSSWSLRPWCFLAHHGLPFQVRKHHLDDPGLGEALRPHGSDGQVPVLLDGPLTVWESLAILEHLDERFPHLLGWPADPVRRSLARSASAEMHAGFADLRRELPMNTRRAPSPLAVSPAAQADIARICDLWRRCRALAAEGPWLLGGFGIVDAMFAPVVLRFHRYAVPLDPACEAYVATALAGPALRRWCDEAGREPWVRPQFER